MAKVDWKGWEWEAGHAWIVKRGYEFHVVKSPVSSQWGLYEVDDGQKWSVGMFKTQSDAATWVNLFLQTQRGLSERFGAVGTYEQIEWWLNDEVVSVLDDEAHAPDLSLPYASNVDKLVYRGGTLDGLVFSKEALESLDPPQDWENFKSAG